MVQQARPAAGDTTPTVHISAGSDGWRPQVDEVWRFREVLYFLVWRDVRVRYKQTAIGVLWAVLQPLATMAVFALVFGRLARMPSEDVPYSLFALCGLVPWQLFLFGLTSSANSLVGNERLITKVYFPRVIIPAAAVLAGIVDFVVALLLLLVLMALYGRAPGFAVALLPVFLALTLGAALAVGLSLSALSVRYRDVRHALPFLAQLWMFATPIVYPTTLFGERWRPWLGLNPMTGVVEGFRWTLLGTTAPPATMIILSAAVVVTWLGFSMGYFLRTERTMADEI